MPVNVITGANTDRGLDFRLEGPLPLEWFRYYDSSRSRLRRALGWGHGHELDRWLRFDLDGMRYLGPDGAETVFPFLEEDGAKAVRDGHVLERIEKGLYRVRQGAKPASEFRFHAFDRPVPVTRVFLGDRDISLRYGEGFRLESVIDSLGRWIEIQRDDDARTWTFLLHEVLGEPPRHLLRYAFDGDGNLVQGIDPYRNAFAFRWDARNRLTARTDRRGYTFFYEYDAKGRCHRSYGEDGVEEVDLRYTDGEGVTEVVRGDGGKWTYFHDETGFLYQIIDPYGGVKAFKPDADRKVTEEIDPNGNVTKVVYDEAGNPVGKVSPFGRFAPMGGKFPEPTQEREPSTPLQYELGDFLHAGPISAPTWKSEYLVELPPGVSHYLRIVPKPIPGPGEDQAQADAKALQVSRPEKPIKDVSGLLLRKVFPDGTDRAWAYDKNGNVSAYRDRDKAVHRHDYSSWNLRARSIDPLGRETRFAYDPGENLVLLIDPGGTRSEYEYDLKDRLIRIKRHGEVKEEYVYDQADNLVEKKSGDGVCLVSRVIGKGNQVKARHLASGGTHEFTYDTRGRYLEAISEAGKATFAYDAFGNRIEDLRDGTGVTHTFERWSLSESLIYGKIGISFARKGFHARSIKLPDGKEIVLRKAGHGLLLKEFPNGSRETCQFDRQGRVLCKVVTGAGNLGEPWARRFSYSPEGNLLEVFDNRLGMTRYRYDAAHRLSAETRPDGSVHTYLFDAGDNLLEAPQLTGVSLTEGNRLRTANGDVFEYDARNQIASRLGISGRTDYTYDSRGMLIRIAKDGMVWWSAEYDPLGRRVRKTVHGMAREYFWDGDRLASEADSTGAVRIYVYPDIRALVPVAFLEGNLASGPESFRSFIIYANHLGVPVLVEDGSGHAVWAGRCEPYGTVRPDSGADFHMPLRFPGHYFDRETGLHYNRNRYYSPELGRYLQSDPIGINGGTNLYAYARGNPLRWVDTKGLNCPNEPADGDPPIDAEGTSPPRVDAGTPRVVPLDEAITTVGEALDNAGVSTKRVKAFGVSTHEDGTVTVALSGSEASVQSAINRAELPDNYRFGPVTADRNGFEPPPPQGDEPPYMGDSSTCVEPRLGQGSRENGSPVVETSANPVWRGDPADNPYPRGDGTRMEPCPSCRHNADRM